MIEEAVRDAFARAETLVPDAATLLPAIDTEFRRRRGRRRVLRSISAAVALLLVVGAAPLLTRALLRPDGGPTVAGPRTDLGTNILIGGLDHVDGYGPDVPNHTDAIIVVHVPLDRSGVYLISIPRDLAVTLPGGSWATRISAAYALGSSAQFERAVGDLAGVGFDATTLVNLGSLPRIVDALGGVQLCVDTPVISLHTGRRFEPGCRLFAGPEAKDYLRQRVGLADGVAGRDRHLVQFLSALLRQTRTAITDPVKLAQIVTIIATNAVVDARGNDIVRLVTELAPALGTVTALTLPTVADDSAPFGVSLTADAPGLFTALRNDTLAQWAAAHPGAVMTTS